MLYFPDLTVIHYFYEVNYKSYKTYSTSVETVILHDFHISIVDVTRVHLK